MVPPALPQGSLTATKENRVRFCCAFAHAAYEAGPITYHPHKFDALPPPAGPSRPVPQMNQAEIWSPPRHAPVAHAQPSPNTHLLSPTALTAVFFTVCSQGFAILPFEAKVYADEPYGGSLNIATLRLAIASCWWRSVEKQALCDDTR
jgi:hypothetical protein